MSETKSCPRSYKRNIVVELFKRRKNILRKRKASWKNLFHKYSQPVSNDVEINFTTLMPEGCNTLKNNVSKDKISTDTELRSIKNVETNLLHKKDINAACHTRMIWSISSTGLLMALINVESNKTISVKKQYVQNTNFIWSTELKGSTKFIIRTQTFDFDSD